jgi:hypothetical protein
MGVESLFYNEIGVNNTAVGFKSLYLNTSGHNNAAFGVNSLYSNTEGERNTSVGYWSLYNNTTGCYNTVVGAQALNSNTTGNFNTVIGFGAGGITTGSNNIAIGYYTGVPSATESNQVRIGNTSITYAGIEVPWTVTSDGRVKSNILNSNLGLSFISVLRPVSYIRNNDEKQRTEYGFIAQEVEEVLKENGLDNTGMISVDDEGTYSMRYNDLIAPIVKAIQELKAENDILKSEIESMKNLKNKITQIEQVLIELKNKEVKEIKSVEK